MTNQTYQEVSCDTPDAYVVMTRVELAQHSPFYMDIESAVAISGAMLMAMAVAFVFRQVLNSLSSREEE
ncbi:hypothetical protein SR914_02240 [Comamonas testosteroni]|uniref:hypothetical protein n=1 Tax=Comamonas testosteroni TaxID=285 RepID=UPI0002DBABB5|nr:hypothetical protein [Comamonas testosteroni]WQG67263.1 hypothetical protein SR914_02240 [Comamonas testosteroni]